MIRKDKILSRRRLGALIAIGGGAYGIVSATASTGSGAATTASSTSATSGIASLGGGRIQRSLWTGRRRINRHGRQRFHFELHDC